MGRIQPIGENILLKPDKLQEKTESGLIIPESAEKPALFGIIEAVGIEAPEELKPGQKIAYAKYSASASEIGDFVLINWRDIVGIIHED
jgi:chaperonin GroES